MKNREMAEELYGEILNDFLKSDSNTGERAIKLIEQALSEPRPYFDGEYYHLTWWHREIAKKFIGEMVCPYDNILNWNNGDENLYDLTSFENGRFYFGGIGWYHIAIPKSDYERVMREV